MRKLLTLMLVVFAASVSSTVFAGTPINQSELPKAAQTFIAKYFADDQVRKAEKDNGYRGVEYEVDFVSGAEVEFKSDGDWKEVKAARGNSVPSAIVPFAIAKYVDSNFKGLTIVEIARKRGGYEVELSNGTELKLTQDAKPMQPRQGGKGHRR
ncbi:PepSY-like domain-containing protein [uncultured Duncaniella sp.]|uniref:PepSY-like domain-containing protein n=1 Tax=uncultured Duncaniella sp. TaxID=2768039 RepID=UPI002649DF65|nr:PepSY-like domain-containing protein [uncultured Duncaniella sp.]